MSLGGGSKAKESESSKALAKIGADEWERFQTDFAPHERAFTEDVMELGSKRERDVLTGRGIAEIKQNTGAVQPGSAKALVSRAAETGSGASGLSTESDLQAIQRKAKGIGSAVGLGRDISTGSTSRLGRASHLETTKNIADASAENIQKQGLWDAVGTAAGYGFQQYGSDIANYAGIASGRKYDTQPFSGQSFTLANEEWGIG